MKTIEEKIQLELKQVEDEYGIRVLYAIESGSRAWGFPSPDSDYDVRFIYVHPKDWYLSIFDRRDVIEKPITDELDLGGWDIKKALGLLAGSNAPLIEWLHSPIVYFQDTELAERFQELARACFKPRNVCYHYYAMAEKLWKNVTEQEQIKLKTVFYVLRALLCSEWIIKNKTIPPVAMRMILDEFYAGTEFHDNVETMIHVKAGLNEKKLISRDDYTTSYKSIEIRINELFSLMPESFPDNPKLDNNELLDAFLADNVNNQ